MKRRAFLLLLPVALNAMAQPQPRPALKLVRTIPLPGVSGRIDHLALDAQGRRLFVAALGNDTVEVIDLKAGRRIKSLQPFSEPQGLAYLPGQNRLFVANGGNGTVDVLDASTFEVVKRLEGLPDADNVRYDAKAGLVYVGYGRGALAVIRTAPVEKVAAIEVGGHPESFQLDKQGSRVFVNVPAERSVLVVDRVKRAIVARWALKGVGSNFPMALDESDRRLFVGCRSPARLLILDAAHGTTVAKVPISGDTDDVFYDAKRRRLYLSCGEGFLDVIQGRGGNRWERVTHVATRRVARTSFYSAQFDRLYLAVPKRGGKEAEIRVYQPE